MTAMKINFRLRDKAVRDAMRRAPDIMERHLGDAMHRGAEEMAREAKRVAPKAHSTLVQSIKADRRTPFRYRIGPHVDYGRAVEEGTGPGGNPPIKALMDWIRVKRITPDNPVIDERGLARLIRDKIRLNGTPAQPYMAPTAEKMESRVMQLIRDAAQAGMREAGLA